jgi:hypothetical protein
MLERFRLTIRRAIDVKSDYSAASDKADYITGRAIPVDGAQYFMNNRMKLYQASTLLRSEIQEDHSRNKNL